MGILSDAFSPELKLQMGVFGIENGKLFLRKVTSAAEGDWRIQAGLIGVVEVPSQMQTEKIYLTRLDERFGDFTIENQPRDPQTQWGDLTRVDEMDADDILRSPIFKQYVEPNMVDLFLRDTEIPPTREGYKWVIATGASKAFSGESRMIEFKDGDVSVTIGERHGQQMSQIVTTPEWGNPDNPYSLSSTIHHEAMPRVVAESRKNRHDEDFDMFVRLIEEEMPSKSCYSRDEYNQRQVLIKKVMKEIFKPENNGDTPPSKPKSRM